MSKPDLQYAGFLAKTDYLFAKYRVWWLIALAAATAWLRDRSLEANYLIVVLWSTYILLPIWVYAGKNNRSPVFRFLGYFVCGLGMFLIFGGGAVLLARHFNMDLLSYIVELLGTV